jgi:hypothetical protein
VALFVLFVQKKPSVSKEQNKEQIKHEPYKTNGSKYELKIARGHHKME